MNPHQNSHHPDHQHHQYSNPPTENTMNPEIHIHLHDHDPFRGDRRGPKGHRRGHRRGPRPEFGPGFEGFGPRGPISPERARRRALLADLGLHRGDLRLLKALAEEPRSLADLVQLRGERRGRPGGPGRTPEGRGERRGPGGRRGAPLADHLVGLTERGLVAPVDGRWQPTEAGTDLLARAEAALAEAATEPSPEA